MGTDEKRELRFLNLRDFFFFEFYLSKFLMLKIKQNKKAGCRKSFCASGFFPPICMYYFLKNHLRLKNDFQI